MGSEGKAENLNFLQLQTQSWLLRDVIGSVVRDSRNTARRTFPLIHVGLIHFIYNKGNLNSSPGNDTTDMVGHQCSITCTTNGTSQLYYVSLGPLMVLRIQCCITCTTNGTSPWYY
jgi:hypothetical protein